MRHKIIPAVFTLLLFAGDVMAREAQARLSDYARRSAAIIVCTVEKDNGDGTVTVRVNRLLKGALPERVIVSGETGFCVRRGRVSEFVSTGKTYLLFLFEGNRVGRLGGILEIKKQNTLDIRFMTGFEGTEFDRAANAFVLPLAEAERQISKLLMGA